MNPREKRALGTALASSRLESVGKGTWRVAATLLALALPSPAFAAADMLTDPYFPMNGWQTKIGWSPPARDVYYPVIAIVDSGLWSGFDDFAGYLDDESADCTATSGAVRRMELPADVTDWDGHGTKVATLAAAPANGKGSVGVSPNSHVIVVRVTIDNERFGVVCAFNYLAGIARAQPLVVNLSFEFGKAPPGAPEALGRLIKAGALVVAAAGNNPGPVQWPANAPHVLAVGLDHVAGASGRELDLVAPGSNLRLPDLNGQWRTGADSGTSFSSPIVAGAAARVWGPLPVSEPQVITYLLRKNAKKLGPRFGFGLVNIGAALAAGTRYRPPINESEPNDNRSTAQVKWRCARTCTLRGLVTSTDDRIDFWRLRGRGKCPARKLRVAGGVTAKCFRMSGRGGGTFVKVQARKRLSLGLYTITVPR